MLHVQAEFPAAGSDAFLAPTGEHVRIQRRNHDGTLLISSATAGASGNTTVERTRLYATQIEAVDAGLRGKRRTRKVKVRP